MAKLYGVLESESRMRVTHISFSGNRPGFIEVESVLTEGEGELFVNPITKEQWREIEASEESEHD